MAVKSKTGMFALAFFTLASFLIFVSFVSPNWLVTDGKLKNPKFVKIGLWEVCFNGFEEIHHWYDTTFYGCWWIFEEEYYIIHDFLLPGFLIATQFFYSITFSFILVSLYFAYKYIKKDNDDDNFVTILITLGTSLMIAGIFGLLAVIIFGIRGDGRDWMRDWQHNHLGWAYVLGSIGVLLNFPSGILFLVEARVQKYKRLHEMQSREPSSYTMHERKVTSLEGHTDI